MLCHMKLLESEFPLTLYNIIIRLVPGGQKSQTSKEKSRKL